MLGGFLPTAFGTGGHEMPSNPHCSMVVLMTFSLDLKPHVNDEGGMWVLAVLRLLVAQG